MSRRDSREQAVCYLYESSIQPEVPASTIISNARDERDDEPSPYATLLFKTALEHQAEIDAIISSCSENWGIDRIAKVILAILRMAICEIRFLPEPPPAEVAINEALELVRYYDTKDAVPFVNGILAKVVNQ